MRFFYKERKVRNGYITAFGLLTISYLTIFYIILQMERRTKLVNETSKVINTIDILVSCIKDAEISMRNYIWFNDTLGRESYEYQNGCINSTMTSLNRLLSADPVQISNSDTLYSMIHSKQVLQNSVLEEYQRAEGHTNRVALDSNLLRSARLIEDIRQLAFRMQTHESEKLSDTSEIESAAKTLKFVHLTTFLMALLLVIYSVVVFNNVSREKLKYREQLEKGIEDLRIANEDLTNLRSIEKFAASGRVARTIAHEVRNPLTNISLAAEQLGESMKSEDEKLLVEIISRNAKRINKLVVELIDSTKFAQLKITRHSLNSIVDGALELAKDRIELNSIEVIKKFSPNQCFVEADSEKLQTAVLNIIINSIEAMEPGKGILELTTMRRNNKCLLMIKDNGIGMNESSVARVFEPYFTQKENGNGLGLTLTQNIILNHKGNISVESQPGKGTLFTVSLREALDGSE